MDVRFRPLDRWPLMSTPSYKRLPAHTFRSHWNDTLALLERELTHLKARAIVIEVGLGPGDIRIDGWPRADAREPAHPGVAISFDSVHGPLRYLTDTHARWRHNVHAIALALQALRAVDRYGVTHRAEQYRGWAALPAGTDHAVGILYAAVGEPANGSLDSDALTSLYRRALKASHPDHGGSDSRVREVLAAGEALGLR